MKSQPVIGLEVHVELKTVSKMFCGCAADYFGALPNSHTCPICLGLPGSLPVPNQKAVEWTVLLGIALGCQIPQSSQFDRKHYFYPDLPKGFQITQYDEPLAENGKLAIPGTGSVVGIRRVHLEEDTAKLVHQVIRGKPMTLVDFNRSGVPLVEIVTEPDLHSPQEMSLFLKELRRVIRYLKISDCDMEQGTMRLEPNVSIKTENQSAGQLPDYKVEIKNINSFRFAERAVAYEISRQTRLIKEGKIPIQETRGWDEKRGVTLSQRSKEEAHDYRYFPEPDIPPIHWSPNDLTRIKGSLPELPAQKRARFQNWFRLPAEVVWLLTDDIETADWYEESLRAYVQTAWPGIEITARKPSEPIAIDAYALNLANWVVNELARYLPSSGKIDELALEPANLAELLYLVDQEKLTATKAKEVLAETVKTGLSARAVIEKLRLEKVDKDDLEKAIDQVISENQKAISDYHQGKKTAIQYLIGQVMRLTKGQAGPAEVKKLLLERLHRDG